MLKSSPIALSGYRRLIRASVKAFGKDKATLKMAKIKLKGDSKYCPDNDLIN